MTFLLTTNNTTTLNTIRQERQSVLDAFNWDPGNPILPSIAGRDKFAVLNVGNKLLHLLGDFNLEDPQKIKNVIVGIFKEIQSEAFEGNNADLLEAFNRFKDSLNLSRFINGEFINTAKVQLPNCYNYLLLCIGTEDVEIASINYLFNSIASFNFNNISITDYSQYLLRLNSERCASNPTSYPSLKLIILSTVKTSLPIITKYVLAPAVISISGVVVSTASIYGCLTLIKVIKPYMPEVASTLCLVKDHPQSSLLGDFLVSVGMWVNKLIGIRKG
jgi:hypothetical protein